MNGVDVFRVVCARHESPVLAEVFLRGNNGMTGRPMWATMPGRPSRETLLGDRLHEGIVNADVVATGLFRERVRILCPAADCSNDVPAKQEKLDAALERFHAVGVSQTDLDTLRRIL